MKSALVVLLLLISVGLGGLYWKASRSAPAPSASPDPLADRVADLEASLHARQQEVSQLRDLLAAERSARAGADQKAAAAPASLTTPPAAQIPTEPIRPAGQPALTRAAALRSPRQNGGSWSRLREHLYDDLLARADLGDTQTMDFHRLIRMRRGAEFAGGWLGEEETLRLRQQSEDGLRKLLGDRYGELDLYEQQLPARMFADRFDLFLGDRNARLDPAKKGQLVDALVQVPGLTVDQAQFKAQLASGQRRDLSAYIERQLDESVRQPDRLEAAAQSVLSPEEKKALTEFLGARRQEQEANAIRAPP